LKQAVKDRFFGKKAVVIKRASLEDFGCTEDRMVIAFG